MLYLGHLVLSKSKTTKKCEYCHRLIKSGDSQRRLDKEQGLKKPITRVLKNGTSKEFRSLHKYRYFHPICFKKFYSIEEEQWEAKPFRDRKAPLKLEGKLKKAKLTEEQRRRRHTIQLYLSNKFRKQLIAAYVKQDTQRVIEVQNRMADYLEELQSFGPSVQFHWLDLDASGCKGTNLTLHTLVKLYDNSWLEHLWYWKDNPQRWMNIFRRKEEDSYMPVWRMVE